MKTVEIYNTPFARGGMHDVYFVKEDPQKFTFGKSCVKLLRDEPLQPDYESVLYSYFFSPTGPLSFSNRTLPADLLKNYHDIIIYAQFLQSIIQAEVVYVSTKNKLGLLMPFVEGRRLSEYSLADWFMLLPMIISVLAHHHRAHGDLSPNNILVNQKHITIIDNGFSVDLLKKAGCPHESETVFFTNKFFYPIICPSFSTKRAFAKLNPFSLPVSQSYALPFDRTQFVDNPLIDIADIMALGIMFYMKAYGLHPFPEFINTPMYLLHFHRADAPQMPRIDFSNEKLGKVVLDTLEYVSNPNALWNAFVLPQIKQVLIHNSEITGNQKDAILNMLSGTLPDEELIYLCSTK